MNELYGCLPGLKGNTGFHRHIQMEANTPNGMENASLREMGKQINEDMDDLLITDASVKKLTVNTLFERYMATKNIKERTKKNYIRMWDYRIRNTLGNIRALDFKTSHVRWYMMRSVNRESRS